MKIGKSGLAIDQSVWLALLTATQRGKYSVNIAKDAKKEHMCYLVLQSPWHLKLWVLFVCVKSVFSLLFSWVISLALSSSSQRLQVISLLLLSWSASFFHFAYCIFQCSPAKRAIQQCSDCNQSRDKRNRMGARQQISRTIHNVGSL